MSSLWQGHQQSTKQCVTLGSHTHSLSMVAALVSAHQTFKRKYSNPPCCESTRTAPGIISELTPAEPSCKALPARLAWFDESQNET